ncbi:hypothetical protein FCL40_09865 [Ferrimonas sediminicola]|uniref:Uncharacterized protein n=1 Tax=Ferrimonas sediminicola TaxID=2569538 RepID=A0A4U1BDA2_9GAMM|nr:hypothetical protein [Ferrimonas sediminicola]TKB48936.1 hypothetical protein FCL40_09865 [Ferrimonas sediminicola]
MQLLPICLIAMVLSMLCNFVLINALAVMGDPLALLFSGAIFVISLALRPFSRAMADTGVLRCRLYP